MKEFIKNELSGWKPFEIIWFFFCCVVIMGLSVYWGDSLMGIVSSIAGIAYSVCSGKGKLSAYFFGVINSLLYGMIAYRSAYYGETMLNLLYYFPMQFVGFYIWSRHMNQETHEVIKKRMSNKGRALLLFAIVAVTVLYGFLLKYLQDPMPFIDSFTTSASVFAMIISVKMLVEQWWIWFFVNACSVYMWWCDFSKGSSNMATLLMWVIYLANAVIMLVKWNKEIQERQL